MTRILVNRSIARMTSSTEAVSIKITQLPKNENKRKLVRNSLCCNGTVGGVCAGIALVSAWLRETYFCLQINRTTKITVTMRIRTKNAPITDPKTKKHPSVRVRTCCKLYLTI